MFAIVEIAGKQFKVAQGDRLEVPKLQDKEGVKITLDTVLLKSDNDKAEIGTPYLKGAVVELTVKAHKKADKIRVFKKQAKKRFQRTQGHRQQYTLVEVTGVR